MKVSWDDEFGNIWEINVPNHQPIYIYIYNYIHMYVNKPY